MYYLENKRLPDFVCIDFLRYSETYMFPVTFDNITIAKNDIEYVRNSIKTTDSLDYPMKKSGLCPYCDFKDVCFPK